MTGLPGPKPSSAGATHGTNSLRSICQQTPPRRTDRRQVCWSPRTLGPESLCPPRRGQTFDSASSSNTHTHRLLRDARRVHVVVGHPLWQGLRVPPRLGRLKRPLVPGPAHGLFHACQLRPARHQEEWDCALQRCAKLTACEPEHGTSLQNRVIACHLNPFNRAPQCCKTALSTSLLTQEAKFCSRVSGLATSLSTSRICFKKCGNLSTRVTWLERWRRIELVPLLAKLRLHLSKAVRKKVV